MIGLRRFSLRAKAERANTRFFRPDHYPTLNLITDRDFEKTEDRTITTEK